MKDFKTYDEQINLLKTRGLLINDESFALEKLKEENYYNIINGYKELFITSGTIDNFVIGSTFEEIYALYDFDRVIKNILFKQILKVENILRSLIAYNFSEKYGNDNYLKMNNFETLKGSGCTDKRYQERVTQIQTLLANLQSDISKAINKKTYIKHYILNYGFVPLWVLVNAMTLGRLSQFYSLMNQSVRVKVSKHWNIKEEELDQYIKVLAYYRNLCAHDERIYDAKSNQDIPDTIYHSELNISQTNARYDNGKNDLFSLIIVLKILLPDDDFTNMCNKIEGRMISLRKKVVHISCETIFHKMGFPSGWIKIKKA
ncbi:MAG: Abi family protein [Bacilli bacterium]|nr:Abi family protein [Bacilli bacterium]